MDIGSIFGEGPGYYFTNDYDNATHYGELVMKVQKKKEARILTEDEKLTRKEISSSSML